MALTIGSQGTVYAKASDGTPNLIGAEMPESKPAAANGTFGNSSADDDSMETQTEISGKWTSGPGVQLARVQVSQPKKHGSDVFNKNIWWYNSIINIPLGGELECSEKFKGETQKTWKHKFEITGGGTVWFPININLASFKLMMPFRFKWPIYAQHAISGRKAVEFYKEKYIPIINTLEANADIICSGKFNSNNRIDTDFGDIFLDLNGEICKRCIDLRGVDIV